jgi:DNA-directed RNA polymerase I subunit RPA1
LEAVAGDEDGLIAANANDSDDSDTDEDDDEDEGGAGAGGSSSTVARLTSGTGTSSARAGLSSLAKGLDKANAIESDKYLVPLEVEAHMKLLWKSHAEILDFIWSRAISGGISCSGTVTDTWTLFFRRAVLVPPSRFRPAAVVGEAVSEHPQNVHLTRILEANEKILRIKAENSGALIGTHSIHSFNLNVMELIRWVLSIQLSHDFGSFSCQTFIRSESKVH